MSKLPIPIFELDAPIIVEGGPEGYTYSASKLNIIGRNTRTTHQNRFAEWLQSNWKFNETTKKYIFDDDEDEDNFNAISQILWTQGFAIAMSDTTRKMNAQKLYDLLTTAPEFFEKCYDAAVTQNNVFDPDWAAVLERMAQDETRKEDGTLKTADEVAPLESGTPKNTSKK